MNLKANYERNELKASYDAKATRIVATTRDVDRDGEVVDPKGVSNFDSFMEQNPVILWQHRHNEAPIGKAVGGRVTDDRMELDIEWAPTPMGQEVKSLYDNGFMSSFSIGFIPRQSEVKSEQLTWTQWELLEVSAVSIPANPMATIINNAESRGLELKALKGMYGEAGTPDVEQTEDAAESPLEAEVEDAHIQEESMAEEKTVDIEKAKADAIEEYKAQLQAEEEKKQREAEKAELEQLRKEKAEKAAEKNVGQNKDDFHQVKAKGGENYRGVNLNEAQKAFVGMQANRGREHVKLAERPETKDVLAAFADLQEKAIAMSNGGIVSKDMTNTDANGGYLNPIITHELMGYARLNSVALRRANVINMQTDYERIPVENAKVSLGYTAEATEAAETSATFTVAELTAKDLDGYADVAMHLEMDASQPIAALLLDQFTEEYGQKIDSAVFAGTGDPVSGIFLGYGRSEVFSSGSTSFSEVLATNLINAIGKLEKPRRRNAAWFSGRSALWTYIMNLKDGNDNPFFVPDMTGAGSDRLIGYPVEEVEDAPSDAASTAMAVFGDLTKFLIGSRLGNLTLFRDPYSLSYMHYTRYVFWTRVAFANPLPNSFVAVATPAS